MTGLLARELGGGRGAMLLAALAAMPFALGCGSLMQYVAFDYLWWIIAAYFFVGLCKSGDPVRWRAAARCDLWYRDADQIHDAFLCSRHRHRSNRYASAPTPRE